jgi:transglutaminase-like putative cysteine protease
MRYHIEHTLEYRYAQPVELQPHTIRLRPKSNGHQTVHAFTLNLDPVPISLRSVVDLDGNTIALAQFDQPVKSLEVKAVSEVETHLANPFDYLLEPWATRLPIDYPASLLNQLQPYLKGHFYGYSGAIDAIAAQLAQEIALQVNGQPIAFLMELNARIHNECEYQLRETGAAFPPGMTWKQRSGSCRDYAVLFAEVCRAVGLAARFVSGYQEGDGDVSDRHLHAWAEVYLPGGGWRGFDPTQQIAVGDRHIALVASPYAHETSPLSGSIKPGGIESTMNYQLLIQPIGD